jgi:hypothetical protein
MTEIKYYGDYTKYDGDAEECLTLKFSASSRPLKERWRNNGISSDYVGDYFATFLPKEDYSLDVDNIMLAVSHISNELLENAMKFSDQGNPSPVVLHVDLRNSYIVFRLVNIAPDEQVVELHRFINKFLHIDPVELFILQMEQNMENENGSGIGYLSMVNDYRARIGWGILKDEKSGNRIVTQVTLPL